MTTQIQNASNHKANMGQGSRLIAGAALIAIGLLILAGQFIQVDWLELLFLPALGLIFLVWGIGARTVGLLIPGGILSGIGLGVFLVGGPLSGIGDPVTGGVFMLCFALGWALITLLSPLAGKLHWWPLIPGGVMALFGGALLAGSAGLQVLNLLGKAWPLGLIAGGLYLILRWRASQE